MRKSHAGSAPGLQKKVMEHSSATRTSRRDFVAASGTAVAAAAFSSAFLRRRAPYDLVIRGGTAFDGSGSAGLEMDVAVAGGRIAAMARRITAAGTEEIDARGLAVAPGFIDIHSHGDGSMEEDPRQESVVRQGITTIVVGQDGSSRAPRARARSGGSEPDDQAATSFRWGNQMITAGSGSV